MRNKKITYICVYILFLSLFRNTLAVADVKAKEEKRFYKFIKSYILTDENQIFLDKKHLISIFGGYDQGVGNAKWFSTRQTYDVAIYSDDYSEDIIRRNGQIALNYSLPTKFWYFNGRFSFGLFSLFMHQNINNQNGRCYIKNYTRYYGSTYDTRSPVKGSFMNHTLGFEMVQELIFGHPNLYFTFGLGVSYQIVVGTSNFETNNKDFDYWWNYRNPRTLWNNSNFNFVIKASVGHRFNNGLIIEANWKHYSNGNLSEYNWGLNFLGITIGYLIS